MQAKQRARVIAKIKRQKRAKRVRAFFLVLITLSVFGIFATVDSSYILALLKPAIPEFPLPTQDNTRTFTAVSTNAETATITETPPTLTVTNIPEITRTATPFLVVVRTGIDEGNLNLRAGPGLTYQVILALPEKAQAIYLACSGNWANVIFSGTIGFVYGDYLEVNPCQKQ